MTHDDKREAPERARPDAPAATAAVGSPHLQRPGAPAVDPFRMAISELQEDLCEYEPPASEPPPDFGPDVLAVTPASPIGPTSAGAARPSEPPEPEQAPAPAPPKSEPARTPQTPRVILPEPTRARPSRVLPTAAVALACGLLGGGVAVGLLSGGRTEDGDRATATQSSALDERATPAADGTPSAHETLAEDLKALRSQTDGLAKQVGEFAGRLKDLPSPESLPDLARLRNTVDDLSKITTAAAPLSGRIQQLDGRAQQLDDGLKAVRDQVASLRTTLETMTAKAEVAKTEVAKTDIPRAETPQPETPKPETPKPETPNTEAIATTTPAPAIPSTVTPPATEDRAVPTPAPEEEAENEIDRTLAQGAELFRQGKYKEALGIFNKLELTRPNDARVWYYAALCYGFATSQWGGGTVRLVEKGVELEQAGTPDRVQIDAAFRDLGADRGKEWLDGYRKLVKTR